MNMEKNQFLFAVTIITVPPFLQFYPQTIKSFRRIPFFAKWLRQFFVSDLLFIHIIFCDIQNLSVNTTISYFSSNQDDDGE